MRTPAPTVVVVALSVAAVFGTAPFVTSAAQQPPQRLEFEVASIRPSPSDAVGSRMSSWPPGSYSAENVSVRALIEDAYDVRPFQIVGGPGWVATDRYYLLAKWRIGAPPLPASSRTLAETEAEAKAMLRSLLEDRFTLKVRHETRELPAYALRQVSGGARLSPMTPGSCVVAGEPIPDGQPPAVCGSSWTARQGEFLVFEGAGLQMEALVRLVDAAANRPVVDETGLTSRYDMRLRWRPLPATATPSDPGAHGNAVLPPAPVDPPVFGALEDQFGLRVQPTRARVDVLVIESIERPTPD